MQIGLLLPKQVRLCIRNYWSWIWVVKWI